MPDFIIFSERKSSRSVSEEARAWTTTVISALTLFAAIWAGVVAFRSLHESQRLSQVQVAEMLRHRGAEVSREADDIAALVRVTIPYKQVNAVLGAARKDPDGVQLNLQDQHRIFTGIVERLAHHDFDIATADLARLRTEAKGDGYMIEDMFEKLEQGVQPGDGRHQQWTADIDRLQNEMIPNLVNALIAYRDALSASDETIARQVKSSEAKVLAP